MRFGVTFATLSLVWGGQGLRKVEINNAWFVSGFLLRIVLKKFVTMAQYNI